MKILHVINTLDPNWGGTVACVRQLGVAMGHRGHEVEIASLSDTRSRSWVGTFPVRNVCLGPSVLKYSFSSLAFWWLLRNVSSYDVLVINGLWQFQGVATAVVSWIQGKPYVVYVHGMLGPFGKENYWKFLKKFVYWILAEYWVLRGAKFVIFTSKEEAVLARDFFPFYRWREAVVENGVESPLVVGADRLQHLHRRFPELEGKDLVMFLGRLHPGKGCDILLEAFATEFRHDVRYHLMIVGPKEGAEYAARLVDLARTLGIEGRVTWTGMLTGEDKEAAFALACLFVLPSHHENFGMAIVEALARGVPVITTNKVNIHSALYSAGAAIICDDTIEGVSGALREWVSMTAEARASLRARQRNAFEQLFSVSGSAVRLEDVLTKAVA